MFEGDKINHPAHNNLINLKLNFMKHLFFDKRMIVFFFLFSLINLPLTASCIYKTELTALANEDGNFLTWSTKSESNNQFFIIERSINGIDFEMAGKLNGAGNSKEIKEYSFSDLNKNKKYTRYFYRLVQIDIDETVSFSHVVVLTRNTSEKLFEMTSVNSSIVDQYFNINFNSKIKSELSYTVQTQLGDVLLKGNVQVMKGSNAASIDLNDLEVGRYQFALRLKNEITVIQVKKVEPAELPTINLATKNRNNKN